MKELSNIDCSGCKISMFCRHSSVEKPQSCTTSLKAITLAFVVPLIGIFVLLCMSHERIGEQLSAVLVILFLAVYYLIIRLLKPNF